MSDYEPRRLLDRLLDICIGLAVCAGSLYLAVWLIQQILWWLIAFAVVGGSVGIVVWRRSRW